MTDDLTIYIPTFGRVGRQRTLSFMPQDWKERTFLVVRPEEAGKHKEGVRELVLPEPLLLGRTRQWIMENAQTNLVLQLDDDLDFCYRADQYLPQAANETQDQYDRRRRKLHAIDHAGLSVMFTRLESALRGGRAHIGISAREGNHTHPEPYEEAGRVTRALGYRRDTFLENGIRFDRLDSMNDFDATLQLLRLGYPNIVVFEYAQGQQGSNTPGGCMTYRDAAWQEREARTLAELHPGFVRVVEKPAKNWKGFEGTRWDVRVSWKKAYEAGKQAMLATQEAPA